MHLKSARNWNCDDTFWACPNNFSQIYVIMSEIHDINVPLVFIFMKSKSKNAYERIFIYINNKANCLNPQFITIDFEMSAYIALKNSFKDSKIRGCFFPFYTNVISKNTEIRTL
ncbi:hypothetical protein DMUE_1186 [Dictyocoela muelleri]|nr:hypothetical protein DMUE_1186 [Dictyocoela muelleri]